MPIPKSRVNGMVLILVGLLVPRMSLALCAAAEPGTYDTGTIVMLILNIVLILGFLVALLLLPIGIFIRIKNKKIDQKKYKKGVRISAISAMTIVIVFGLYFFSTFLGSC